MQKHYKPDYRVSTCSRKKEFTTFLNVFTLNHSHQLWQVSTNQTLWKTRGIPAIELFVLKFEQIVNSIVLYGSDKSPRFRQSELKYSIVNYYLHYTHKILTHLH